MHKQVVVFIDLQGHMYTTAAEQIVPMHLMGLGGKKSDWKTRRASSDLPVVPKHQVSIAKSLSAATLFSLIRYLARRLMSEDDRVDPAVPAKGSSDASGRRLFPATLALMV